MKKVVTVSGLPGSGKSTVSEGIAQKLAIPLFSVDPIESAILRSGIQRSFETGLAAYLVAETLAAEQLRLGVSVIIDAVNSVNEAREMWRDLSLRFDARLILIECVLDPELHKQRIESRVRHLHGIPEVTWSDIEDRRREYIDWKEARLILNTANRIDANIDQALEYISAYG